MKALIIFLFLFLNADCSATNQIDTKNTVYVCGSGNGKKYHLDSKCRGLSNCHYKVVRTTLEKAKRDGKTLCKWESR